MIDLPTTETASFVAAHAASGSRILEIGCGNGTLAAHLSTVGYRVVGLDANIREVARARRRGVDAHCVAWPECPDLGKFDAVVFTRSLHHLSPITSALARATQVLVPDGRLLVEDFTFNDLQQRTIDWFAGILELLDAAGALGRPGTGFGWQILATQGKGDQWIANSELNSATEMRQALASCCTLIVDEPAPYFYRYVWPMLRGSRRRAAILARVRDLECRAVVTGSISPLGRRFVGGKTGAGGTH